MLMRDYARYAITILFFIGVIVLIVVGFNLIRNVFRGDDRPKDVVRSVNLQAAGDEGKPVRYTISGTVVGEDAHREIRITVDRSKRLIEVIQGYNNEVLKAQEFPNSQPAYNAFIDAIDGAGFSQTISPKGRGQESKSCPLGLKYSYEVAPDTSDSYRTWSNNCKRNEGTFTGSQSTVQTLFQKQIPQYSEYVSDVKLSP